MKNSIINDSENQRTIVRDWENEVLTIKGDCSPSSISCYAVYSRFSDKIFYISITRESAASYCNYLNEINHTNEYFVCYRTIFV